MGADSERSLPEVYDFARLERAVAALLRRQRVLEQDNAALAAELEESRRRALSLDVQLAAANQRRLEILGRIDPLLCQLDELEAQIASATSAPRSMDVAQRNAPSAEGA